MIAIGGAIGTGLVIGTGGALAKAGPGSVLIAYAIMGFVCFMVMCALGKSRLGCKPHPCERLETLTIHLFPRSGEMATYIPHRRGFAGHATRFVSPSFGFATGFGYLFKYLLISPNQLVAASLVIRFWRPDLSPAIWITIFLVAILVINFLGVAVFGELEFWLSLVKILTLTGLIILSFLITVGASPTGEVIGFKYWSNGRAFLPYKGTGDWGRFLGFWSVMINALFAYSGTELVGVTVGEARNPRKSVPRAIKATFFRICFFYVLAVFFLGMIVASDSPRLLSATNQRTSAAASPFVVAIQEANIKTLPAIINACILIFTLSAANSDLYIASRTLYGLSKDGHMPRLFRRCNAKGVPWVALIFCSLFLSLAYITLASGGITTFNYFVNCVTVFGGLTWISIAYTHTRFIAGLKAQGIDRNDLPYKAPLGKVGSYIAVVFTILVVLTKGFDTLTTPFNLNGFITQYIGLAVWVILWLGHNLWTRQPFHLRLQDMDMVTGARVFNEEDDLAAKEDDAREAAIKAAPFHKKIWMKLQDW